MTLRPKYPFCESLFPHPQDSVGQAVNNEVNHFLCTKSSLGFLAVSDYEDPLHPTVSSHSLDPGEADTGDIAVSLLQCIRLAKHEISKADCIACGFSIELICGKHGFLVLVYRLEDDVEHDELLAYKLVQRSDPNPAVRQAPIKIHKRPAVLLLSSDCNTVAVAHENADDGLVRASVSFVL